MVSDPMKWTDIELMDALRDHGGKLNKARAEFSAACGRIDQATRQREPLHPVTLRRMEFDAVVRIADKLGVKL